MFTPAEAAACQRLVEWSLEEDLGGAADRTSEAVLPAGLTGRAAFVSRAPGVLAGLPAVRMVLSAVDPRLSLQTFKKDGDRLNASMRIALVSGPMHSLLAAERIALNFLSYLSGVATLTRRHVDAVSGLACEVFDTRKTLPGYRRLAKYAVRCGGGFNHRMGLYDAMLIKDNHLAALGGGVEVVTEAVRKARSHPGLYVPIEVEVDSLEQFDAALKGKPDAILLDNMTLEQLREAVKRRDAVASQIRLEASGGVNLGNLRAIAQTGVDRVSIGALTHSAVSLDIGLDYLP
jgi:nicotinate-nucleotide pyrophosphorylase (carboxylating)